MPHTPSYFLSTCSYDFLKDRLNRNYPSFRNIEPLFEQHRKNIRFSKLLDQAIFEILTVESSRIEESIFHLEQLNTWFDFFSAIIENQDLLGKFVDGFLRQYLTTYLIANFDYTNKIKFQEFFQMVFKTFEELENLTEDDLRFLIQLGVFYLRYPTTNNLSLTDYDRKYFGGIGFVELFEFLYVKETNPVLLIDQFIFLQDSEELDLLASILEGKNRIEHPLLEGKLNKDEYKLFISSNHPKLSIRLFSIQHLIHLCKYLHDANVNSAIIYRYFQSNLTLSLDLLPKINNYLNCIEVEPSYKEFEKLILFYKSSPKEVFLSSNERYLYKKELTILFKQNPSVFSDSCEIAKCNSKENLSFIEWTDKKIDKHITICDNCLFNTIKERTVDECSFPF